MFEDPRLPRFFYRLEKHQPEKCTECGRCMRACPREYPIVVLIAKAGRLFAGDDSGSRTE